MEFSYKVLHRILIEFVALKLCYIEMSIEVSCILASGTGWNRSKESCNSFIVPSSR